MPSLRAEDLFSLKGRRALITGASRGIAAAIAEAFAVNGAEVGINFSAAADAAAGLGDAAAQLQARIAAGGGRSHLFEQDMLQADAAQRLAAQVTEVMGGCDILVISASLQVHKPLLDMPTADTERQLRLNILSTVDLLQALVPAMQANRRGRILAIGSVQQAAPSPEMPIYAATKAAVASIVKSLAIDLAPYGVTINSLAPGLVETDRNAFRRRNPEDWQRNVSAANPMGRAGQPTDMVGAALFLCSDASAFVTGSTVFVSGGAHIPQPGYNATPPGKI